jgi:hypothetical protein
MSGARTQGVGSQVIRQRMPTAGYANARENEPQDKSEASLSTSRKPQATDAACHYYGFLLKDKFTCECTMTDYVGGNKSNLALG